MFLKRKKTSMNKKHKNVFFIHTGCLKWLICFFCQNFYHQWHLFSQILQTHVLNQDTHVDHFWCL